MKLCLGAAVLMLMRTPVLPLALLGDYLHSYFPDIPTSDTYGKVSTQILITAHRHACRIEQCQTAQSACDQAYDEQ
jgi:hypothetical protein